MEGSGDRRKDEKIHPTIYVIFVSLVLDLLGFTVILPLLPSLLDYYEKHDKFGIATSYALWAVSHTFGLFVLSRVIGGLSKGNISLSTAIVTDVSSSKTRGKGMALIGVAFSVGFIIGPVIGAGFSAWAKHHQGAFFVIPALFALVLALIDIAFITIFYKESLDVNKRARSLGSGLSEVYDYIIPLSLLSFKPVQNLKEKDLGLLQRTGLIYFLYLFIYSGLEYSLTFMTHLRFNYTRMQQGRMYLFSGTVMALIQGGYVRRIHPGQEPSKAVMGLLLIIPSFVIMGLAPSPSVLYVGLILFSFASATVVPCLTTIVSSYGSTEQKGTVLGIFRSLGALARSLGPFVISIAYWSLGPTICYCVGSALLIIPYILLKKTEFNLFSLKTESLKE
ncbi:major facilitator superfamily domain-containing protein rtet isoform X2 [Tachypleus tridentatus]|uniref:major facilitator superfamily domain-containing protein rtet isoform X2 n=1 Tax=Tachypleus tridentatus TaxID=6853 RepID=UPI003FD4D211